MLAICSSTLKSFIVSTGYHNCYEEIFAATKKESHFHLLRDIPRGKSLRSITLPKKTNIMNEC